jgi:hypothetical protein
MDVQFKKGGILESLTLQVFPVLTFFIPKNITFANLFSKIKEILLESVSMENTNFDKVYCL